MVKNKTYSVIMRLSALIFENGILIRNTPKRGGRVTVWDGGTISERYEVVLVIDIRCPY